MNLSDAKILKTSLINSVLKLKEFVDQLLDIRIEIIVITFSGILSFLTAAMCYRNVNLYSVRLVSTGKNNSDIIALTFVLLVVLGLACFIVAFAKLGRKFNINFNKFLLSVVSILLANFIVALMLSEFKAYVIESVDKGMMEQLEKSVIFRRRNISNINMVRSSNFEVISAWDAVQIKLGCCGVYSYRDYIPLYPEKSKIQKVIPVSCCSIKNVVVLANPEGVKQCYVDAIIDAVASQFLNTQGCQGPLQRWLVHLVNKITYLIYVTTCFQGFTVLYLSYYGYKDILRR